MKLGDTISAVVTGGASGLGAATARRLAASGVKVTLFDMNVAENIAFPLRRLFDLSEEENLEFLWQRLREFRRHRLPMGCGTHSGQEDYRGTGLCGSHAYSIIDVREVSRSVS